MKPNGYFGPATLIAVKAYQKSVGLPATGYVFPLTRATIKKETCTVEIVSKNEDEENDNERGDDDNEKRGNTIKPPVIVKTSTVVVTPVTPVVSTGSTFSFSDTVSYDAPSGSPETIHVTLGMNSGIIATVAFSYDGPISNTSGRFLKSFTASLASTGIIGKKISDVSLSRVGCASLTTNAFMRALGDIAKKA